MKIFINPVGLDSDATGYGLAEIVDVSNGIVDRGITDYVAGLFCLQGRNFTLSYS